MFKLDPYKDGKFYKEFEDGCTWELRYPIIAVPLLIIILPILLIVAIVFSPIQYIWNLIKPKSEAEKWLIKKYS